MEALLWKSAAEIGRGIENRDIDPIELTEAFLEKIGAHEFGDRIYACVTADRARAEAKAASDRAKAGVRRSPLDGVPISWKDLFDTAGTATEAGTALLKGRVPDRDAKVLARATDAGLVCLGKTHMTELAFSGLGYNPVTASSPNVNDPGLVSGGSSSGAATSVAFGLAAIGIGSDTGGSVRVPSAWNDLVGLKTVAGRLPLEGVVPLCARFDTVGPLCRTVEDAALMFAILDGGQAPSLDGATLEGARLAILDTVAFDNIADKPHRAFQGAVDRLQAAGALIEHIDVKSVSEAMDLAGTLYAPEAYGTWRKVIDANPEKMFGPVRERFQSGASIKAVDFVSAWQRLDRLRADYIQQAARFDAVILPSVLSTPPYIAEVEKDQTLFVAENLKALHNTRIGNLMGLAGVTLPTGVPSCGISIQGQSEERLLRLAAAAEAALA